MSNIQATAVVFILIAAMLAVSHEWLPAMVVVAFVAAPALLAGRKSA